MTPPCQGSLEGIVHLRDVALDRPTGQFELAIFRRGEMIEQVNEANLVVDSYKLIFARLLGGDTTNRSVTQFGVGTNPATPLPGNTVLTDAFVKPLGTTTYPTTNTVRFAFSLAAGEANGMAISEFGLLTAGGVLFARKTRAAPLHKAADITIAGTWTITF